MAQTVRGSQTEKPLSLEFGKTTVYERKNIRRIEEPGTDIMPGFSGWEYEEEQYTYEAWHLKDSLDNKLAIAELAELIAGGDPNDKTLR